jgi:hypothetical protein
MKRFLQLITVAGLVMALVACSKDTSSTSADASTKPESAPASAAASPVPTTPSSRADAVRADSKPDAKPDVKPEPKITVPAGAKLRVALLDAVSSDKSQAGDTFNASLTEPVIIEGKTVLAKGTKVRGRVVDAQESGRVKGRASLELKLTDVVRNGKSMSIATKTYTEVAEPTKKRDAEIIGGGAGLGAAIGAIAGGGKGAAIGAAVGGGAGGGTVLATKGKDIRFAPEHLLVFTLASPIEF